MGLRSRNERSAGRLAIVSLTPAGGELAQRLAGALEGERETDLYTSHGNLAELLRGIWGGYENIVLVMAVGIAVRAIAPLLRSKWTDPGVVVVDEKGSFAVSLVGGHWGMANDLARDVAAAIGAIPVVTTATDVQGKPAIDLLARICGFLPLPRERVKLVNKAFLTGERVVIYTEWDLKQVAGEGRFEIVPLLEMTGDPLSEGGVAVFVTSRQIEPFPEKGMLLCPRSLVAGVGCKRGVSSEEVLWALESALELSGRRRESLRLLASHLVKENEEGLRDAAQALGIDAEFFGSDLLQSVIEGSAGLQRSDFVKSQLGVEGVCEPAAMAAAREGRLVLPKTRFGRVTVALAEDGLLLSASGLEIRHI